MINFEGELHIEDSLIKQLTEEKSQWTLKKDIHTVEDLWNNFRDILVRHNKEIFDQNPLTDNEFKQVQNQLRFPTSYDAAKWLMGENGIARVKIVREDASLGVVRPVVFKRADIAGGSTVYQVVHQIQVEKLSKIYPNRRGDVTLLMNGLPMIHIELKNRNHPYMDAFRQIKKYLKEGVFRDIFSTLQMFVVSNGTDTRYIAAANEDGLNSKFLSAWLDDENKPVTNYLPFARDVLSIPAAHRMVSQYTVLDSERKSLIMLRPYQIHAVEAIRKAADPYQQIDPDSTVENPGPQSGYVWHTTGSGKTLTAYKVAHNLTEIPSINKTIFVVDRQDLDNQTTGSFQAYAEYDTIDVDSTDNTNDLVKKLLTNGNAVIVTTIHKLRIIMKRYRDDNKKTAKKAARFHQLHLAFVVDECHRAVSAKDQADINAYFNNPLWYGFTGTPIFEQDAKNTLGNLPATTAEQYGPCLNKYTIKEAIHDAAVLGFQVEYQTTFNLKELADKNNIDLPSDDDDDKMLLENKLMSNKLIDQAYEQENHMLKVIDFIVNKSQGKFGLNREKGKSYSAILTTSSIAQAQKYYELFKKVKNNEIPSVKISNKTRSMLTDFPKVAITYSITENDEGSSVNQDKMAEAMKDYNKMFDTKYALDTIKGYNNNVNDRLARKKKRFQVREEQLDLVIVVDRLLTGFDAPSLTTLFVDRKPMRSYSIIQAFSRTNRLFDQQKKYGQIVIFQTPAHWKKAVDDAVKLYSSGGGNYVQAPSWAEAEAAFLDALHDLRHLVKHPADTDKLTKQEKVKFLKLYINFDNTLSDLQVYSEFQEKDMRKDYHISMEEIEEFAGKYNNIKEELNDNGDDNGNDDNVTPDFDVNYELRFYHEDQIDEDYILSLMEATRPDDGSILMDTDVNEKLYKEINAEIDRFEKVNPRKAEILKQLWKDYQDDPANFVNQSLTDVMNERISAQVQSIIHDFANEWCVNEGELSYFVETYDLNKDESEKQLNQDALKKAASAKEYKLAHPDKKIGLKYWKLLLQEIRTMVTKDISPLIDK